MPRLLRCLIYFICAPFVLVYAGLLVFLFINGVNGSETWLIRFWNSSKACWTILALLAGLVLWVFMAIRILL